jgi:hypothetical protein
LYSRAVLEFSQQFLCHVIACPLNRDERAQRLEQLLTRVAELEQQAKRQIIVQDYQ